MLPSLNIRILICSSPASLGTFFKHFQFPLPKPSFVNFSCTTAVKSTVPLSSSSSSSTTSSITTVSSSATGTPNLQALTSQQKHQIHLYVESLLQWNQKMNLTSVKDENEVMERHVEDSLAIIDPLRNAYLSHCGNSFEDLSVVDVGSGAGLPGLVLAIAFPSWKILLLESMNKRCVFLEHAVDLIGLQNVRVVCDRAENLGQNPDFREGFDIAVARAVAEMRVLAEYCLPLVRVGGLFIAAKGHDPQEELNRAKRAIQLMGSSVLQICLVESHSKLGQRTAIICRKDCTTPKRYPRSPGTPSKLPL